MFIIEYISKAASEGQPKSYSELALGSTVSEARDQADTHLAAMTAKYGAVGYRIIDKEKQCVATGPKGFQDS